MQDVTREQDSEARDPERKVKGQLVCAPASPSPLHHTECGQGHTCIHRGCIAKPRTSLHKLEFCLGSSPCVPGQTAHLLKVSKFLQKKK